MVFSLNGSVRTVAPERARLQGSYAIHSAERGDQYIATGSISKTDP